MSCNDSVIDWLLEDSNPAVAYRTETELLQRTADRAPVVAWVSTFLPGDWRQTRGLWYRYHLTALAECGLCKEDIEVEQGQSGCDLLTAEYDSSCADFMLVRSLIKLGYQEDAGLRRVLADIASHQLPDGGFLCLHRLSKLSYTPKSCMKANLHALLCYAECAKRGITLDGLEGLVTYFFERDIFYRRADHATLVLNCRPGGRTIDTFHPFELSRIGLHNLVESFSALGYGHDAHLSAAWALLHAKRRDDRYPLEGTLAKSYLPKERVGKPSKWVTLYALLAEMERDQGSG